MKTIYLFLFSLSLIFLQTSSYAQSLSPATLSQFEYLFQDSVLDYREVYSVQINGSRADTVSSVFLQKNQGYITSGYELLGPDSLAWKANRTGTMNDLSIFAANGVDTAFREKLYKNSSGADTLIEVFSDTGSAQLDMIQRIRLIYGPQGIDTFRVINFSSTTPNFEFVTVRDAQQRTDSIYIFATIQGSPTPISAYRYIYTATGNRVDTIVQLNAQNNFSVVNKLRPTYDNSTGKIERVDILEDDGSGEFTLSQRLIFSTGSSMGMPGLQDRNALSLYPNPSREKVQIQGFSGTADLKLYSQNGQMVKAWQEVKAGTHLSIEKLPAGSYIFQIDTQGPSKTLTLYKE